MKGITPAMRKELERRMAAGEPLPQGFRAVPEGQVPPQGMMPTGVTAQADGKPIQPPDDLTPYNPIVADNDGLTLMRNAHKCPLPNEATTLQQTLQMLTQLEGKLTDRTIEITAQGLAAYMHVGNFCGDQMKDRVVVEFAKDTALAAHHQEIQDCTTEMQALQKQMQAIHTRAKKAIEERWAGAVKNYGLNPAKNFYALNERDGTVIQLSLDCAACKGKARLRKSRQGAQEHMKQVQTEKRKQAEASSKPLAAVEEQKNE